MIREGICARGTLFSLWSESLPCKSSCKVQNLKLWVVWLRPTTTITNQLQESQRLNWKTLWEGVSTVRKHLRSAHISHRHIYLCFFSRCLLCIFVYTRIIWRWPICTKWLPNQAPWTKKSLELALIKIRMMKYPHARTLESFDPAPPNLQEYTPAMNKATWCCLMNSLPCQVSSFLWTYIWFKPIYNITFAANLKVKHIGQHLCKL